MLIVDAITISEKDLSKKHEKKSDVNWSTSKKTSTIKTKDDG